MGFIAFFVLPASLVLGIISLSKKNSPKWLAVTSIIGSSITMIVNTIMFFIYFAIIVAAVAAFIGTIIAFFNA